MEAVAYFLLQVRFVRRRVDVGEDDALDACLARDPRHPARSQVAGDCPSIGECALDEEGVGSLREIHN